MTSRGIRHTGSKRSLVFMLPVIAVLSFSCSSTKHVPDDRYLLNDYSLEIDNERIDQKELNTYVRPKPNKKILGMKFYLRLYNLSRRDKDNGFNNWLRKIGEEPVIYDEFDAEKNVKQIKLYLRNKGYYYASVDDTARFRKKKAEVAYDIETGAPYVIRRVEYFFEDTSLRDLVLADTVNSLIRKGILFDVDIMQAERTRIERMLKRKGYYNFTRGNIQYRADSLRDSKEIILYMDVTRYRLKVAPDEYIAARHRRYRINTVYIYPDYNTTRALIDLEAYLAGLDSLIYNNFVFRYRDELRATPAVLAQSVFIFPEDLYNLENVEQTYEHLSSLRIFKLVNVDFVETDSSVQFARGEYYLDCHIQLAPMTRQNYTVELTGTNSSGNIGVAGNLSYQHRNLFGGAENFTFGIKGAIETLRESYQENFGNMLEFGVESRLRLPKFLLPFEHQSFIRKYNPKTNISLAFNYQRRPDYTRTIANTAFGYAWTGSPTSTHFLNPIELNLVRIPNASEDFYDRIKDTYLENTFEDKLIQATSYTYMFNNQDINKLKDFLYLRFHGETSGNLLQLGSTVIGESNSEGRYEVLGTEFSQYFKTDADFRYYRIIDDLSSVVYRAFIGTAYPYGNSIAIPFEKQYFSGGANGIRAWQVRNLGPGAYVDTARSVYPNKTADIKLEGNIEYRFKLFWVLEGALFVDAGNVWAVRQEDDREGALFRFDSFYKEIAVGTGFGTRMDFSFFIFRLDVGLKLRDPALPEGSRWIISSRGFASEDLQLNLAIGYPF